MDLFNGLNLIGGLSLFLFGMSIMGDGLTKLSGGKLEMILEKLTSKKIMAVCLGALVTAIIQSSSATTVMVVGFVNSGIMKLSQAVGIIMGANIGTTITSWILSLTGIQSSNVFVRLLKPSSFSPIFALIGLFLYMSKGKEKKKDLGVILLGFAVLMFGMESMSASVAPLSNNPSFTGMLTMFSNPILGMSMGALLTALIQSSSASVGILQALCATGAIRYNLALPIIMGQNIGTCVTAILSSVGSNKNAKKAAMIHLYFNLIGTILFMIVFYSTNQFVHYAFLNEVCKPVGIAIIHSLFNIGCVIVLYPFSNLLVKLAEMTVPDREVIKEDKPSSLLALDARFLDQPSFALDLCSQAAYEMVILSKEAFSCAMSSVDNYSKETEDLVCGLEEKADVFEDEINRYLVKLSSKDLSEKDSRVLTMLLHCLNDIERISDHSLRLMESSRKMWEEQLSFSQQGSNELKICTEAVMELLNVTIKVFKDMNVKEVQKIEPLKEVIHQLTKEMKQRHIQRLKNGECDLEMGMILQDIILDQERVADHCSNIGLFVFQSLEDVQKKYDSISDFQNQMNKYARLYLLP